MKRAVLVPALVLCMACAGRSHRNDRIAPSQSTDQQWDPEALQGFREAVEHYVDLHRELRERVPNVAAGATPDEVAAHRAKMQAAILAERHGARHGDFFDRRVEKAFRRLFATAFAGPRGADMVAGTDDGNPRVEGVPTRANPNGQAHQRVRVAVNAVYNDDAPLSSVPSSLLLRLPVLPDEIRYRFVGPHLILGDAQANVILDYILDVVPSHR
jgi:hypothetical protein